MRLYLRKDAWLRVGGLSYDRDIDDLGQACQELWERIEWTPSPKPELDEDLKPAAANTAAVIKVEEEGVIDLTGDDDDDEEGKLEVQEPEDDEGDLSAFALGRDQLALETPEVVLSLLSLEELVALGKKMKVNPGKGSVRVVRFCPLLSDGLTSLTHPKPAP